MKEKLKKIHDLMEKVTYHTAVDNFDGSIYTTADESEDIDEIEDLCCQCFIGDDGRPNYSNISLAHGHFGLDVGPGEQDSFGWLTGYVRLESEPYNHKVYFG